MDLRVNGQPCQVPPDTTVLALLHGLEVPVDGVAVAVNHAVVPKSAHAQQKLDPGDDVEIIQAVGGG